MPIIPHIDAALARSTKIERPSPLVERSKNLGKPASSVPICSPPPAITKITLESASVDDSILVLPAVSTLEFNNAVTRLGGLGGTDWNHFWLTVAGYLATPQEKQSKILGFSVGRKTTFLPDPKHVEAVLTTKKKDIGFSLRFVKDARIIPHLSALSTVFKYLDKDDNTILHRLISDARVPVACIEAIVPLVKPEVSLRSVNKAGQEAFRLIGRDRKSPYLSLLKLL